jgi:hypothetical protein
MNLGFVSICIFCSKLQKSMAVLVYPTHAYFLCNKETSPFYSLHTVVYVSFVELRVCFDICILFVLQNLTSIYYSMSVLVYLPHVDFLCNVYIRLSYSCVYQSIILVQISYVTVVYVSFMQRELFSISVSCSSCKIFCVY